MTNTKFNISVDDIAEALKNGATPDDIADSLSKALNAALERNKEDAKRKSKIADMQTILDDVILYITTYYKTAENAEVIDSFIEEINDAEIWVDTIDKEVVPAFQSLSKFNELLGKFNEPGTIYPLTSRDIDIAIRDADSAKPTTPHTTAVNVNDRVDKLKKPTSDQIIQNFLNKMGL